MTRRKHAPTPAQQKRLDEAAVRLAWRTTCQQALAQVIQAAPESLVEARKFLRVHRPWCGAPEINPDRIWNEEVKLSLLLRSGAGEVVIGVRPCGCLGLVADRRQAGWSLRARWALRHKMILRRLTTQEYWELGLPKACACCHRERGYGQRGADLPGQGLL